MGLHTQWPLDVQVGSSAAVSFQRSTCLLSRLRGCVDMREAWVQELRDAGLVRAQKVKSEDNLADGLTKGMPNYKFQQWLRAVDPKRETKGMEKEMAFLVHLEGSVSGE